MDFRATKDNYERETDEAERLVRPSPKIKPSRHDRKREDMQTEDEPDPDLKSDPDMSLNYKSVGGSARVLARWLQADEPTNRQRVRKKDTGNIVYVSEDTLKERGGEYESADEEEATTEPKPGAQEKPAEKPQEATKGAPDEAVQRGAAKMVADKALATFLEAAIGRGKSFDDELQKQPDKLISEQWPDARFPPEIKTLGDLSKALKIVPTLPPPAKAPKTAPLKVPQDVVKKAEPPAAEPAKAPDPVAEKLDRLISVMERFMAQAPAAEQPAIKKEIEEAKKPVEQKSEPPAEAPVEPPKEPPAEDKPPREQPPLPQEKPEPEKPQEPKPKKEPKDEAPKGPKKIAEPKRRKVTADEQNAARIALVQNLSGTGPLLDHLIHNDMHPDDVNDIIRQYHQIKAAKIKPEDLDEAVAKSRAIYVTDPAQVPHPAQGQNAGGKITNWDDMTPEEQSVTYAAHRNQVVAASMALRERVTDSIMAKNKIPRSLATTLAASKLSTPTGTPDEQEEKGRDIAQKVYDSVMASGEQPEPIDDESVKATLERTKNDPVGRRAAVAYFQAVDYLTARDKFLTTESEDQIDERDPPRVLASTLLNATRFLQQRAKRYPEEYRSANDAAEKFRTRVMSRLRTNFPEKAAEIEPQIQAVEADEWDEKSKLYDELQARRDKGLKKYERAHAKAKQEFERETSKAEGHYRAPPSSKPIPTIDERLKDQGITLPPEPDPIPPKPIGYDEVRKGPQGLRAMGRRLMDKLLRRRTASVVARFLAYSTCEAEEAMGKPSSLPKNTMGRTAVYWGVDPAAQYPGPYSRGDQAHARDLNETDFDVILTAARQWLKSTVLSKDIDGIVPDTQFRAALDLAIRDTSDGRYSVGLHPTLYNRLLAKLAGKPETETLLTVREASSGSLYARATEEERHMSASATIRKFAATIAETNPGIAFDLTNMAFKLAEDEQTQEQQDKEAAAKKAGEMPEAFKEHIKEKADEKKDDKGQDDGQKQAAAKVVAYTTLKASVIKAAQANPAMRAAFLPVLQTIKQIG